LTDCAVATSGTSRKHWQKEGRPYHHLIDPLSGTSAETGARQATVIAPRAIEADVFAKTLFILGLERGQAFASDNDIPALFVAENGKVISNLSFQQYEWKA
jgi:thiamine biosynthesis lipoprotein